MQYRPEIDGLRTLAVVPVILFHADIGPFQGGFTGVDIFFVISGYLITSLLIGDIERGTFNIMNFYERRIRRILPALFLVMFVSTIFAVLWMFPLELNAFFQSLVATTLFSSNILFFLESGYFSQSSDLKPLLHTWSLAIEEQYYIFFPPLLFLIWKGPKKRRITTLSLGIIALASFVLCVFGTARWPDANFYLLPARAWELLVGSFCAIYLTSGKKRPQHGLSVLGLILILAGLIWSSDVLWPSWMTVLPVLGTALVIVFSSADSISGKLLATRPMVGIGLVSYSAYLWHQPIFAFTRLRSSSEPPEWVFICLILLTFILAYLTWQFVEKPFRSRSGSTPQISRTALFAGAGITAAIFLTAGLVGDRTDGFPNRTAPSGLKFTQIIETVAGGRTRSLSCDTDISFLPIPEMPPQDCTFRTAANAHTAQRAIVIGDSHATIMSEQIRDMLLKADYDVTMALFGGCMPFPGFSLVGRDCNAANTAVYDHIERAPYDLILIAARPQYVIAGDQKILFQDTENGLSQQDWVLSLIKDGLERLLQTGGRVIFVEPVPEMPIDIGKFVRTQYAFEAVTDDIDYNIPRQAYNTRTDSLFKLLDEISDPALTRIETGSIFCLGDRGPCRGVEDGRALYTDDNHLSAFGVPLLLSKIEAAL